MTRRVGDSEQGELQGALASLAALASLGGPVLFTLTYARSIAPGGWNVPGGAWLLSMFMLLAAAVLALRVTRHFRAPSRVRAARIPVAEFSDS
jgi:DHA1 family tetracycline resistance protein-like MFS transporter